ncbi:protein translocase SEC61 complex subunit gamma [archaeon]|nr:protein translocase SEC61 complex subunit gamma [archaeon]|tara:strand:- start:412 stop:609 length:198 start_codon:yes stop_codon:yes gene_type:complete
MEEHKLSLTQKTKRFFVEMRRVWKITKKPSKQEFKAIVKVTSIGIAIIGLLGFLLQTIWFMIKNV